MTTVGLTTVPTTVTTTVVSGAARLAAQLVPAMHDARTLPSTRVIAEPGDIVLVLNVTAELFSHVH